MKIKINLNSKNKVKIYIERKNNEKKFNKKDRK